MQKIDKIAKKLALKDVFHFGDYIAKVNLSENKFLKKKGEKQGKLILLTSINPTPFGEGKTTSAICIADDLAKDRKKVCLALREPSLGPVFGVKGGAVGSGKSMIVPEEEINLHFTGDFHAITSANNLLCAIIDNHIYQGNTLKIKEVCFHRTLDLNDRALREVELSSREESFSITPACEIMSIMTLAKDENDLKTRLGEILVGFNEKNKPIFAKDLNAQNAMFMLLKNALKPNLVQSKNKTPALVHCGPFANISLGTSSVISLKTALSSADYVVAEAGFGFDCGGEKFLDLLCQENSLNPNLIIVVATIKALIHHGEGNRDDEKLEKGFANLLHHYSTIEKVFGKKALVCLNKFDSDSEELLTQFALLCNKHYLDFIEIEPYTQSGQSVAKIIEKLCQKQTPLKFAYSFDQPLKQKLENIATKVYGGKKVVLTEKANQNLKKIEKYSKNLPVIIAKTQNSLSDNPKALGAPKDFTLTITNIELKNGAGFVLATAGNMLLMPGLAKHNNYEKM